jgi:lipoprotein NlpD
VWHEAAEGEELDALARRYKVPVQDIEEINGLERRERLPKGRVLFIPGAAQATASTSTEPRAGGGARAGTSGSAGRTSGTEGAAAGSGAGAKIPSGKLLWPVDGVLISRFGKRGKTTHEGLDIAAPEGTAVLAAADGKVIYSGSGVRGYGNLVLVKHEGGLVTVYAHNHRNLVLEGAPVKQGQVIAEVGATGKATGSHLHFEVRMGEVPEDPLPHLPPPKNAAP